MTRLVATCETYSRCPFLEYREILFVGFFDQTKPLRLIDEHLVRQDWANPFHLPILAPKRGLDKLAGKEKKLFEWTSKWKRGFHINHFVDQSFKNWITKSHLWRSE